LHRNRSVNPSDSRFGLEADPAAFRGLPPWSAPDSAPPAGEPFRARQPPVEMCVGHLQVMILCNRPTVAQPCTHDVARKLLGEFGLPRRSKIVEQFRPRLHTSPLDDPLHLGAEIRLTVTESGDDPFRAVRSL